MFWDLEKEFKKKLAFRGWDHLNTWPTAGLRTWGRPSPSSKAESLLIFFISTYRVQIPSNEDLWTIKPIFKNGFEVITQHRKRFVREGAIYTFLLKNVFFRTKNVRRTPFYLVSAGNAVLMFVVVLLHDLCDNHPTCSHFTKVKD